MSKSHLENGMFEMLKHHLPHNHRQIRRLARVGSGVLLAKSTRLSHIARCIAQETQQASRVQFVSRFFESALFIDDTIYHLLLQHALKSYRQPVWHLVIDRTNWIPEKQDLLMVSLSYHKRAIPVAWQIHDYGSTSGVEQIALLKRVFPLLPTQQRVILHGDAEFGSVPMMQYLSHHTNWAFILGQKTVTQFHHGDWQWQMAKEVTVTPRSSYYAFNIFWTKTHNFGPINFFAFYKPYRIGRYKRCQQVRYCTTSLPITHTLRRLGHRRWGCEPMFRDFKSSGWQIDLCGLPDVDSRLALLQILSINYLWATSLGRWLCKSGRRSEIDNKKKRHFSLFRLGWDWLIHRHQVQKPIPSFLRLYQ